MNNMKSITLKEALSVYVDAVLKNSWAPQLYLRDEVGGYHSVDDIDLARDRLRCDDGHWEYYEYILEREELREGSILFVEVNDDE